VGVFWPEIHFVFAEKKMWAFLFNLSKQKKLLRHQPPKQVSSAPLSRDLARNSFFFTEKKARVFLFNLHILRTNKSFI